MKDLEQKVYACWLDTVYWLTSTAKYKLLETAGSTKAVYDMTSEQLTMAVGEKNSEKIVEQKKRYTPQKVWNYVTGLGVNYTFCKAEDFPKKLINIPDPPFGIFYKGKLPEESIPSVAMIGARKCSDYGRCMAEVFASELAQKGINIISGMALGIDGISQKSALKAGGRTYGVLGCGVDIVYPRANENLYLQLCQKGAVISEYPPGMEPRPVLFPPRNRIISALSDVVLVIEAREKSGTLITVDMALEQGREVYAVPGRCTDNFSAGCNRLLRQGAGIAISPDDIVNDMMWNDILIKSDTKVIKNQKSRKTKYNLSTVANEIFALLDILPVTQDTIIMKIREKGYEYTASQICQGLVELELKGIILRQNGQYRLSKTSVFDKNK